MQLVSIARNPAPTGAITGLMIAEDGAGLRYARWPATRGPRRGTVVIAPGRGEFIEKYFEVVAELRRRGFAVAVMDWRGQGGSDRLLDHPRKGHVEDFAEYDRDLRQFMKEIVLPDCPPPYTALGHSMGGAILMRNAIRARLVVRPDRAHRAHDRVLAGKNAVSAVARPALCRDGGARPLALVHSWRHRDDAGSGSFRGQPAHVGSGALAAHDGRAGGRTRARTRVSDRWLG